MTGRPVWSCIVSSEGKREKTKYDLEMMSKRKKRAAGEG